MVRPMQDDLVTSSEAAAIIGRTSRTITRMALAGSLPVAHRLPGPNGALLFRRSDVDALAAPVEAVKK